MCLRELPLLQGGGVAESLRQSRSCWTMNPLWYPRTGTTAFLPHLAAATELLIIDLIAQHDPQPDSEFTSDGDSRFT